MYLIKNSTAILKAIQITRLRFVFALLAMAIMTAGCSDNSVISPPDEKNPPSSKTFGLVEVTISDIGKQKMSASAVSVSSLSQPGSGIQLKAVSNGSFTSGTRGTGGQRYMYATFEVRNADVDSTAYGDTRQNLTFMAVDTDASSGFTETFGVTAVSTLRLFDGTELSGPTAKSIAESTIPTGQVAQNTSSSIVSSGPDVLQVYTENDAAAVTVPTGVEVFPYGFITRSPDVTPGSRSLPASPAAGQFDGVVTFAFKLPLQSQANLDPFEISMMFLPVDDSETRITQSLEEQTAAGLAAFKQRANAFTSVDRVTLLPGTNYGGSFPVQLLCEVRAAGTVSGPDETFMVHSSDFSQLFPNPYGGDAHHIGDGSFSTDFTAFLCPGVSGLNDGNFVVQGYQSGKHFVGQPYPDAGGTTVSTPTGSFFPGEMVEVSLTTGLGITTPKVARYRVRAAGSGSFSEVAVVGVGVGNGPRSVTAGDWDGDGDPDLAVLNFNSDNISILQNSGGSFTEVATVGVGNIPTSVTAGDWDGDEDLDLAVSSFDNLFILENNGGSFTVVSTVVGGENPSLVTAGDWDGDGDLDLANTNIGFGNIAVFILQNSGGSFEENDTVDTGDISSDPISMTAGDWNGDGALDLAVMNNSPHNVSILQNSGGSFTEVATVVANDGGYTAVPTMTAGDWDGDGDLDLIIGQNFFVSTESVFVYRVRILKNSGGIFTLGPKEFLNVSGPISVVAGDWNGDGDLDLAVTDRDHDLVSILQNSGGSFTKVGTVGVGNGPKSVTAGDWDGDGDMDLAVVNEDSDNVSILEKQ